MSKRTTSSPAIAVVGMACRVPGAATPRDLWTLLCDEIDATGETPSERYDVDEIHSETAEPGKLVSRRGGYLDGIAEFDAGFFGMSTDEATWLDPQQRLLLMTAWEALEDAGQRPADLAGTRTGVYVGNSRADYLETALRQGLRSATAAQFGNVRSMIPARLSYVFDLRGPSVLVDTACSASLVAVHQAVRSLRHGECPFALAVGVNLPLRPDEGVLMSQIGSMSTDGRSRFADADADGHAPSDAVVVVALKPLDAAIADGDRIRAVIAGSAIGNDGRTSDNILNPSLQGQIDVLRWAYEDAEVDPREVDFVEAHGSGAPQLDRIELTAMSQVLGDGRDAERPLLVGSVKSNLGHSEAASGLVGLVKTVLCLEHGQIPASLHVDNPRPDLDWDAIGIRIPQKLRHLPPKDGPVVAGVSGQGASALNAHIVLRQADPVAPAHHDTAEASAVYPLMLSARDPEALERLRHSYAAYLRPGGTGHDHPVREVCRSAATRRQHLGYRLVVSGATHRELVDALLHPEPTVDPALADVEQRFLGGEDIDADAVFGTGGHFVPLPTYPWLTRRYWSGDTDDEPGDDLVEEILGLHARTGYQPGSRLADIGIDSLAKLKLIVELQKKLGTEVNPEVFDKLRTVAELRDWVRAFEATANG